MRNIDINTFVNSFAVKPNKSMSFLLGAGTSISSGIPSGGQMVWDFKRTLYCTEKNIRTTNYPDMSKESVQKEIQAYFDGQAGFPTIWSPEEYSFYFEKCYLSRRDREFYIQQKVRDVIPSLGYLCLGELVINGKVDLISTTNFDDLVLAGIHTTKPGLSVKSISSAVSGSMGFSIHDGFPNIVKLHGDYLLDKLKNTTVELQELEQSITGILKDGIKAGSLIVLGYAGNDNSVMTVLDELISSGKIKQGVYWCQPKGIPLSYQAQLFIEKACEMNEESGIIEITDFDDFMYRLFLTLNITNSFINSLWEQSDKKQTILYNNIGKYNSVALTNGVCALEYPHKCYVFSSSIATWKELRQITNNTCVAALSKGKVWALGSKSEIINAFSNKIHGEIEELNISTYMMKLDDSIIIGMFYEIIGKVLREIGLFEYGKNKYYDKNSKRMKNRHNIYDGVKISLSFVNNNIILNILPTVHALSSDETELERLDYQKILNQEISVLYNNKVDDQINKWIEKISINGKMIFELGSAVLEFNTERLKFSGSGTLNKCYHASEPEMLFDYEKVECVAVNQLKGLKNFGPIESYINKTIRLAVLTPREYAQDIWTHLNKLKVHHMAGQDADFLPEYIGFNDVFRCNIDIPNGNDNQRFVGYSLEKVMGASATSYFNGLCQYIDFIEKNRMSFDLLIIYIPNQLSKMREIKNETEYFDLHDSLKIYCAGKGIVTQIIEERSVHTTNDFAKIIWGLSTAIYAKAVGRLWKPKEYNLNTAYIGLSYVQSVKNNEKISIGCSQLFDAEGNGMKLYLRPLKNPQIIQRNPFMRSDDAYRLMSNLKKMYDDSVPIHKLNRIVIHKTTFFTKEEMEGITKGLVGVENIELLQIQEFTTWRAIRFDFDKAAPYPIQRGTVIPLDEETFLIWTHGSVQHDELAGRNRNYFKNGRGIPAPLLVKRYMGKSTAEELVNEILMLTKMNWNSGDGLYKILPVTLDFAKTLSRVAKQDLVIYDKPYDFRYFM